MDATDDRDIYLQRSSASLLSELKLSLPRLLFANDHGREGSRLRRQVRTSLLQSMTDLLEPFQESPQLLDQQLNAIASPLVEGFLLCISGAALDQSNCNESSNSAVMPTRRAICKLLYTLCKIRGPKTISRFLTNEANILEPMLNKFQYLTRHDAAKLQCGQLPSLAWEEKYIFMLWLSHLLLTPFDLDSIGSASSQESDDISTTIKLPKEIPFIASRLVAVSTSNLVTAGKEREAAVKVLVRLSLRPDMLRFALHEHLVRWALSSLGSELQAHAETFPWNAIGYLSFIAGVISSSEAATIAPYLLHIFKHMQSFIAGTTPQSKEVISSAVARKVMVKIYRAISLSAITLANSPHSIPNLTDYVLEEVIDHLLTALADKDTPVRHAASKAISVIAAKLQPLLSAEVTDAVVGSLGEDVLENENNSYEGTAPTSRTGTVSRKHKLESVNALRWHGLILTLSQLLFQRSPSPLQLPPILKSLILALEFEQRSSSGTSIGTNVRDAACFGIWSIARRYTTEELSEVDVEAAGASNGAGLSGHIPVLQVLATELTVAAALDPSGNIRRGASAALQELIGRHPDTIIEGIRLVQIVDYHAVALRERALSEVASAAATLHTVYWAALLKGMLGWRGIDASDAASRRMAAKAVGLVSQIHGSDGILSIGKAIQAELIDGRKQDIERRHGLLLAAAALVQVFSQSETEACGTTAAAGLSVFWSVLGTGAVVEDWDLKHTHLRPELTAEATCSLLSVLSQASLGPSPKLESPSQDILDRSVKLLGLCLGRREDAVIVTASGAARPLFGLLSSDTKEGLLSLWIDKLGLQLHGSGTISASLGHVAALGAVYTHDTANETDFQPRILVAILSCVSSKSSTDIETKVAALRSLAGDILPSARCTGPILDTIREALQNYTTDQRGDVGSLVRLEALGAVRAMIRGGHLRHSPEVRSLLTIVCTLAAEKLDKVRYHAWRCITEARDLLNLQEIGSKFVEFREIGEICSTKYYATLLSLYSVTWLQLPLVQGLVASVGSGSESVLRVSRAALSKFLKEASNSELRDFGDCFMIHLAKSLDHERLIVPTLESLAFLLQSNSLQRLDGSDFRWRRMYNLVQKAHYKSGNVRKLSAAVEVYAGLATVTSMKQDVLKRLAGLLLHPLPKVRNAAADSLYLSTNDLSMITVNWSQSPKDLRPRVDALRQAMEVSQPVF